MKYRQILYKDYVIFLPEEIVQNLIRRFDPECELSDCILCSMYYNRFSPKPCEKCPVGEVGCHNLVEFIFGHAAGYIDPATIAAEKRGSLKHRAIKMKEWFKSLPKIEK